MVILYDKLQLVQQKRALGVTILEQMIDGFDIHALVEKKLKLIKLNPTVDEV